MTRIACVALVLLGASTATADAIDYRLIEIRHLTPGARVAWSPDGSRIAFDRRGDDGFYDLWTMLPDGSDQTCLSCEHPELPRERHIGQPVYHPNGEWLVFQVEKEDHHGRGHSNPGHGLYNDLVALHLASNRVYALTDVRDGHDGTAQGGTLHPVFSHDGTRLLWTDLEDLCLECGPIGDWRMLIADFVVVDGVPALQNVVEHQPGENGHWYETHGFGPDDSWIYFSGNTTGTFELFSDINRMNLADSPSYERLTFTAGPRVQEPGAYDEHAHFTRDFDAFVWLNDEVGRAEYWIADADGSDRYKLTGFNVPGTPEYELVGGAHSVPSDNAWNPRPPEGREQLVAFVQVDWSPLARSRIRDEIFLIELARDPGGGGPRPELLRTRSRGCAIVPAATSSTPALAVLAIVLARRRRPRTLA